MDIVPFNANQYFLQLNLSRVCANRPELGTAESGMQGCGVESSPGTESRTRPATDQQDSLSEARKKREFQARFSQEL